MIGIGIQPKVDYLVCVTRVGTKQCKATEKEKLRKQLKFYQLHTSYNIISQMQISEQLSRKKTVRRTGENKVSL